VVHSILYITFRIITLIFDSPYTHYFEFCAFFALYVTLDILLSSHVKLRTCPESLEGCRYEKKSVAFFRLF
jgi:hypothetical protein